MRLENVTVVIEPAAAASGPGCLVFFLALMAIVDRVIYAPPVAQKVEVTSEVFSPPTYDRNVPEQIQGPGILLDIDIKTPEEVAAETLARLRGENIIENTVEVWNQGPFEEHSPSKDSDEYEVWDTSISLHSDNESGPYCRFAWKRDPTIDPTMDKGTLWAIVPRYERTSSGTERFGLFDRRAVTKQGTRWVYRRFESPLKETGYIRVDSFPAFNPDRFKHAVASP